MYWQKQTFPNIEHVRFTAKAILFRIKNTDWQFWHPASLSDLDDASDCFVLTFPPDFEVTIFKYDEVAQKQIASKKLSVADFISFCEECGQPVSLAQRIFRALDMMEQKRMTPPVLWQHLLAGDYSQSYVENSWLKNTGTALTAEQLTEFAFSRL